MRNLDDIWQEVKRLPKTKKLEITCPTLLHNEGFIMNDPLRVYLLPDGRNDPASAPGEWWDEAGSMADAGNRLLHPDGSGGGAGGAGGGASVSSRPLDSKSFTYTDEGLLPSEGNLYLTNYRVIFKGIPSDVLRKSYSCILAKMMSLESWYSGELCRQWFAICFPHN